MPQGLKALTSGNQQKLRHKKAHAKASSKAKAAKKGNPTQLPKNIAERTMALERERISKAINRRVEMVSSARAIKAGDTFSVKDIKSVGKQLNRDIRREEVMRKKTRVEEKLAELQAAMHTEEHGPK